MNVIRPVALAAASAVAASLVLAGPAVADDDANDNGVIRTGSCSGSADWKLKVKTDDGGLEVEGEVDSNTTGQTWAWKLKDNGVLVAKGSSATRGPSGSFDVERKITDRSGTDRIVFKARYAGQTCRGVVAYG